MRPLLLLCLVPLSAACGPSPQPIPPPDVAFGELAITDAGGGRVRIEGLASAGTETLDVISLAPQQDAIPVILSVSPDEIGMFAIEIDAGIGDLFRLQALGAGGERSEVLDVTVSGGQVALAVAPIDCLVASPEVVLDPVPAGQVATGTLTLDNQCPGVLGVDEIALTTNTLWEANLPAPMNDVAPGAQLTITFLHNRDTPGRDLNALVVRVFDMGPTPTLRLFTLRSEHQ